MSKRNPRRYSRTYSSGIQVLAVTAAVRFVTVVRSIVVARLLLPDEFGRFALVAALLGILETTTNSGFYEALIKGNHTERISLRAAWSVMVARGAVVTTLLFIAAGWVGTLFDDPAISSLLRVLAIAPIIRSLGSLGPVLAQRDVNYRWTARVSMTTHVVDVFFSVLLVWVLGSAMGLVIAAVIGALAGVMISYRAPGFSPGFTWRWGAVRPLVTFARWRWISQIAWYTAAQGDDLIVGRVLGTAPLGVYRIAYTVGNLPTTEATTALVQVTFPALARAADVSKANALEIYTRYLTLTVGVAGFLAVTLLGVADPLVRVLLGEAWLGATVPLGIMTVGGFCRALAVSGGALFLGLGRPAWDAGMQIVRGAFLLAGMVAFLRYGVVGAAVASTLSTVAMLPIWIKGLATVGVPPARTIRVIGRRAPVIALCGLAAWGTSVVIESSIYSLLGGAFVSLVVWVGGTLLGDPPLTKELKIVISRFRRGPIG